MTDHKKDPCATLQKRSRQLLLGRVLYEHGLSTKMIAAPFKVATLQKQSRQLLLGRVLYEHGLSTKMIATPFKVALKFFHSHANHYGSAYL
jgi:hypothetical protein